MASMFGYCSSLKTIYISNIWNVTSVTNGDSMFYNCTSLVGAVPFDSTKVDVTMANYTTGYFLRDVYCFSVEDNFPKIIKEILPIGVTDITYRINIMLCMPYAKDIESVLKILKGGAGFAK